MITNKTLVQLPAGYITKKENYPLKDILGISPMSWDTMEGTIEEIIAPLEGHIPIGMFEYFMNKNKEYSYSFSEIHEAIAYLRTSDSYDKSGFLALVGLMSNASLSVSMESSIATLPKMRSDVIKRKKVASILMSAVVMKATLLLMYNNYAVEKWMYDQAEQSIGNERERSTKAMDLGADEYETYVMKIALNHVVSQLESYIDLMIELNYKAWIDSSLCVYCLKSMITLRYRLGLDMTATIQKIFTCLAKTGNPKSPLYDTAMRIVEYTALRDVKELQELANV